MKVGTGTLTLSGENDYSGDTTLQGGTLSISSDLNLGFGDLIFNGGILQVTGTSFNTTAETIVWGAGGGGFDIADAANTFTVAQALTGAGGLTKLGAGTLILSGAETYTGATAVTAGTLTAGAAGAFSANSATSVAAGGILDLGGFAQTINAVTLNGGRLEHGTLTGAVTSSGGTIDGLGGTASVTVSAGTTTFAGINTFTGGTSIVGGTLNVTGSINVSNIVVGAGGILSGTGKLGDPTIAAGGTLAPGTPTTIGTLTIVGPLGFDAGSLYNVKITPTANDRTNVVGVATISGGTVNVLAGGVTYGLSTKYTILNATGGVAGTFSSIATNLAFLTPTLSYDADDVFLTMSTNPVTGPSAGVPNYRTAAVTTNQFAVAGGLTNAAIANGDTGKILTAFNQLTVAQAQAAFDSVSGEGVAATQNIAHRSAQLFNATIFDQTTFYGEGAAGNSITLDDAHPIAMASAPILELGDLPSRAHQPSPPLAPAHTWRAWGTGFGGTETIHGSSVIGSAAQDATIYGGAMGVDDQLLPNTRLGVAVGGSDGTFSVPGRTTSGSTTGGHIAVYDVATFGRFYGASSSSFSYYYNRTTRTVSGFGGLTNETERGNFDSHEFRSRLEFGRHYDTLGGTITPYVALELASLRSNGFGETAVSGPGLLALVVHGQSSASVPSFVGARFQQMMALGNGLLLSPTLEVAYIHEFAPQRSQFEALANLPGSTFLVDGARSSHNSAMVKTGVELALNAHSSLFANFDGEVSAANQYYGGKGGFLYRW